MLAKRARVITLVETPGLRRLGLRRGGAFEPHGSAAGAHGAEAEREPDGINPHLWLDPANAARIVQLAAAALSDLDPANAAAYGANARSLGERLAALDRELRHRLAPLAGRPFLVFHDAYAYLEARYGLRALGAFAINPAVAPGARRLAELRRRILQTGALCVFAEPQFRPGVVEAVVADTPAQSGVLDPLGAALRPGPEAYFRLMRGLADSLVACLRRSG